MSDSHPFYEADLSVDDFRVNNNADYDNSLCEKLVSHIELLGVKRMTQYFNKASGCYKVTVEKL